MFVSIVPNNQVHMKTTDSWKMHRKLMADTMSPNFLSSAAGPQMHNNALSLISLWREKARLAAGHPFNAIEDVKAAAMDIIWAATFGTQMKVAESQTDLLLKLKHVNLPSDPEAEVVFPRAPNPEAFEAIIAVSDSVGLPLVTQRSWRQPCINPGSACTRASFAGSRHEIYGVRLLTHDHSVRLLSSHSSQDCNTVCH